MNTATEDPVIGEAESTRDEPHESATEAVPTPDRRLRPPAKRLIFKSLPVEMSRRLALIVFGGLLAIALPLILVLGREQWFFLDEWDFLAGRDGGSLNDLLRPHNEHWSTLPILAYRVLYRLYGVRTYLPYQLLIVVLHLAVAALLRAVMIRARVNPWVATLVAGSFIFFGGGQQNIEWAFQIGFVGALAFGLGHLLLADHDGPIDRRDRLGLLCGAAGLMCSGVAVAMVVVVGLAALLRRGWRIAAFHTLPLAALYGVWFATKGHDGFGGSKASLSEIPGFVIVGTMHAFKNFGGLWGVGAIIAGSLIVGLVLASKRPLDELRRTLAAPASLLVGGVLFMAISGYGRGAFGVQGAEASRYAHVLIAMTLPALAVAVDALVRRWRFMGLASVAVLAVAAPTNIRDLDPHHSAPFAIGDRTGLLAMANSPFLNGVKRTHRPNLRASPEVTVGWIRDAVAKGKIPKTVALTAADKVDAAIHLSLQQARGRQRPTCSSLVRPRDLVLSEGQVISFSGGDIRVSITTLRNVGGVTYSPDIGGTLRADRKIRVLVGPAKVVDAVTLCT